MRKTTVFVTGGDGFLGQHIIPALPTNYKIYYLKNDLREYKAVEQEVKDVNPDLILHLAARTEVEKSFYEQMTFSEINYNGTVNLIESAAKHCTNLQNFIFASTMEIYGWQPISDEINQQGKPVDFVTFDENTPVNPNAPYAVAKLGAEKYLEYAGRAYGLPYTALRQTNCYGRKDNDFFVVEQIITQMLKNPNEINLGYAAPYRNFIYVDDMVDVWTTVIRNPDKVKNNVYTIGPDHPIQIKELVQFIANKIGWNGKVNWDTKPERYGEIYWLNSNHNKITAHTGWKPKVNMDVGIERTIAHWKKLLEE
jgi:nucleoside-diphosphate-sugar epimerase